MRVGRCEKVLQPQRRLRLALPLSSARRKWLVTISAEVAEVARRDAERLAQLKVEEDEYENLHMTMRIQEAQQGEIPRTNFGLPIFESTHALLPAVAMQ